MKAVKRKELEAKIYDHEYAPSAGRPKFGSYFDQDLYYQMEHFEYLPTLHRWMKQYLSGKKVLIIGASRKDVELVLEYTKKVWAIDISKRMVKEINDKYPTVTAWVHDAEKLERIKQKFDVVFCKSILHHLHPFNRVVAGISKVLKPGGVLFVASEPGLYHPLAAIGRKFFPSLDHTPGERAFNFREYDRAINRWFVTQKQDYFVLFSLGLVVAPTRMRALKGICQQLLIPTLKLEGWLRQVPGLRHLYWMIAGVYRLRNSSE